MIDKIKISVNGIDISYQITGTGTQGVVFIHGNSMNGETWLHQLEDEELNAEYKLIAIDLPGHGLSSKLGADLSGYGPKGMGKFTRQLITQLPIKEFILAGLSFGTNIIGEITELIIGCKGIMLTGTCIVNRQFPPSVVLKPVINGYVTVSENASSQEVFDFVKPIVNGNVAIAERFVTTYSNTDGNFRNQILQCIMAGEFSDELENIKKWKVPVCVVAGENEILVDKTYLSDYAPLWHNKIYLVKGAGHFPNEERPADFNIILKAFAEEVFR